MFKTFVLMVLVGLLGFLVPGEVEDQLAQANLAHAAGPERVTAVVGGQEAQDMLDHLEKLAEVGKNLENKLGRPAEQVLSSGGLEIVSLEEQLASIKGALSHRPGSNPLAPEDFLSRLGGMTQSETSMAWCDGNAVIGFIDSGSFLDTITFPSPSPSFSLSFIGWSNSTNAGGQFTDQGALVSDPLPPGSAFIDLLGDPVVGCTDESTFYYASLAFDFSAPFFSGVNSGISVSKSGDGGASWGGVVMAASKNGFFHLLDKPWMAVEPGPTANPADSIVHVTYTDFDFTFVSPGCPGQFRTAIEYVRSTDGGATWSAPLIIEEVCGFDPLVQGSQVEVALADDVYVAWENYAGDFVTRDIRIKKSTNAGSPAVVPTFPVLPVTVTPVTPVGDSLVLQGRFRAFLDLQGLAVDRSNGPNSGNIYITWHDGSNLSVPEPLAASPSFLGCGGVFSFLYCFGDILLTTSVDEGASWSAPPVRINSDPISLAVDQFMPAVEVDKNGAVYVFYYDRRRDRRNFLIDTFLARSPNAGRTWSDRRVTSTSFPPITGRQDLVVNDFYMGDYIGIATDSTQKRAGVVVSWGDNSLGDANVLFLKR